MRAALALALGAILLQTPASRPGVEFHHFHVVVDDPADAMRRAAAGVSGAARTILQGHGPGVRMDGRYLVFDRTPAAGADAPVTTTLSRQDAVSAYAEGVQWALERGLDVAPATGDALRQFASARTDWPIAAVAFAAEDLSALRAHLTARGVEPAAVRDEVLRYTLPSGLTVEFTPHTDRQHTYWCPMHPDIRAPGPSSCRLCGMALVPIPPPRVGEYGVDVDLKPRPEGGASGLTLRVSTPDGDQHVTRFVEVHERRLHLFIISRDLSRFAHEHPRLDETGTFVLDAPIEPGAYTIIADFLPEGGTPQMVHRAVVTPGYDGPLFAPPPRLDVTPREVTVGELRVRVKTGEVTALRPASMTFEIVDRARGTPVVDLQPYLGAAAHLLIVTPDLTIALHGHPEEGFGSGPEVSFDPVLPVPGVYKMWLQFQRAGQVMTVPFVIEAAPW